MTIASFRGFFCFLLFVPQKNQGKVPIIGVIPCGVPITALEEWEGDAFLPESINADFALRAKGDSMTGSAIVYGNEPFKIDISLMAIVSRYQSL